MASDTSLRDDCYDLKTLRESWEPYAYISRKAYEGEHFVSWNRTQQQLTQLPLNTGDSYFNQLPEIAKQTDSYENFLLSTNFTFTVIPSLLSDDEGINDAVMLSLLAQQYHNKTKETTMYQDFIHWALVDNVSFVEAAPDDQKKDVDIRTFDFFDILFNPRIKNWMDQKMVVKLVRKKKKAITQSPLYKVPEGYQGSYDTTWEGWGDIYQTEKYPNWVKLQQDEILLLECQILDKKGLKIKTIDSAGVVLRDDDYPHITGIPIIPLRIYSGEWYQKSYVYRQLPINRGLDNIFNRIGDLILRLAKGGWMLQEEEDLNGAMNEELGQIVRYAQTKPEQLRIENIPPFILEWFQNGFNLSDRYGINALMSGAMPPKSSGIRADKMLNTLKQLVTQANTAQVSNLKTAIRGILEYTFLFLYELWDTPQDVVSTDLSIKMPQFVSEKNSETYPDAIAIPRSFKRFEVEVDDGLGYTLETRQKNAIELNKIKGDDGKSLLSGDTLKKIFKLGSSGYLLEAEEKAMSQTKEFQDLIKSFPTMPPETQQALIKVLEHMGQKAGNDPASSNALQSLLPPGDNKPPEGGTPPPPVGGPPPAPGGQGGGAAQ